MTPKRYHFALVTFHWLLAVLLLVALGMGSLVLQHIPNESPDKINALRGHMVAGGLILILTLIRLAVRLKTSHPTPASTGNIMLDRLAVLAHYGLYLLVVLMAASGIALSIQANLPAAVFAGTAALPASFEDFAPRLGHGLIAKALIALITAHILAALYHQFVRRDGLLSRMWFGGK
ncbi:cytochrome b [Ferribacterium limneticum]|uniref:cytochrome b n=1 Tax=Ferribacterium limneticum TaxID=76259 RepID=UPI001CFB71C0|nr:cytochrome b/b6 domain-containing protein [Ferribacterium limneticum]UCV17854.1 cytochrome b/b6 domain-containing protein [Ferribacterium limneticum]